MASSSVLLYSPSITRQYPTVFLHRSRISLPCLLPIGPTDAAVRSRSVRAMAAAKKYKGTLLREKQLEEMIEKKVMEAKEVCEGDERSDPCKVAWDEVEEVSQAKADFRRKLVESDKDPLEFFCRDHPETDECRIYED